MKMTIRPFLLLIMSLLLGISMPAWSSNLHETQPEFSTERYFWNQNAQLLYFLSAEKANQRKSVSANHLESVVLEINPALLSRKITTQNRIQSFGGLLNEVSLHNESLVAFELNGPYDQLANTENVNISWQSNPTDDFEVVEQWLLKQHDENDWIIDMVLSPNDTSAVVSTAGVYVVRKLSLDGRYVDSDGEFSGYFTIDERKRKNIKIDTIAPELRDVAVLLNDPGLGFNAFEINGQLNEAVTVFFEVYKDGMLYFSETFTLQPGDVNYSWEGKGNNGLHEDGQYSLLFYGHDVAGNSTEVITKDITFDFSAPVIKPLHNLSDLAFSPNRDSRYDEIVLGFNYSEPVNATLNIKNQEGEYVSMLSLGGSVTHNVVHLNETFLISSGNHVLNLELQVQDFSEKVATLGFSVYVDVEPPVVYVEISDDVVSSLKSNFNVLLTASEAVYLDLKTLSESYASLNIFSGEHLLSFDGSSLKDGEHEFELFVYDSMNNVSMVTFNVLVDTQPPLVTNVMLPATANILDDLIFNISLANVSTSDTVVLFLDDIEGNTVFSSSVSANQDVDFSLLLGSVSNVLEDGEYQFRFRIKDEYQNVTESIQSVLIGVGVPVIDIYSDPIVGLNDRYSSVTFNMDISQGSLSQLGDVTVRIFDLSLENSVVLYEKENSDSGEFEVFWNGRLSDDVIRDGHYVLSVELDTLFGETVSKHVSFVLDSTPPTVDVVSVAHRFFNPSTNSLLVDASFIDGSGQLSRYSVHLNEVMVADGKNLTGMNLEFSFKGVIDSIQLEDGDYVLELDVEDGVGNVRKVPIPFCVDTTPPVFLDLVVSPNVILPDGDGVADNLDILLVSSEQVAPKVLVLNQSGELVRDLSGKEVDSNWAMKWDGKSSSYSLIDGDYVVSVQLIDLAGNMSVVTINEVSVVGSKPSLSGFELHATAVSPSQPARFSFFSSHEGQVSALLYRYDKTLVKELDSYSVQQGYNEWLLDLKKEGLSLNDGEYFLSFLLKSSNGVFSGGALDVVFNVDGTPPILDLNADLTTVSYPDFVTLSPIVSVMESVTLNVELLQDGAQIATLKSEMLGAGSHTIDLNFASLSLQNGLYTLRTTLFDSVGNSMYEETVLSVLDYQEAQISLLRPFSILTPDGDSVLDILQVDTRFQGVGFPHVSAKIFSESGVLVRSIYEGVLSSTTMMIQWDGLDKDNERVESGYYELKLSSIDGLGHRVDVVHPVHVFTEPIVLDLYIVDSVVSLNDDGFEDVVEYRIVPNFSSEFASYDYLSKTLQLNVVWTQGGKDLFSDVVQVEDEYSSTFFSNDAVSGNILLSLSGESKDRIPVQVTTANVVNDVYIDSNISVTTQTGIVSEYTDVTSDTLYINSDSISLRFDANDVSGYLISDIDTGDTIVLSLESPVFTPSNLEEGPNVFEYVAYDEAGNRTPTYSLTLVLDTYLSTPQWVDYVDYVSSNTVALTVSADIGVTVSISIDDSIVVSSLQTGNPFTYYVSLEEGQYLIGLDVVDMAGNQAQIIDTFLEVDTTPPVLTEYVVVNAGFEARDVTINEGTMYVNASVVDVLLEATEFDVVVVRDGGDIVSLGNQLDVLNLPLTEGNHIFTFEILDNALNRAVVSYVTVNVDATIQSPYFLNWEKDVNTTIFEAKIASELGATVSIMVDGDVIREFIQRDDIESIELNLEEGTYVIGLFSEDNAGNVSSLVNYNLNVDLTLPVVNMFDVVEPDSGVVLVSGGRRWVNTSALRFMVAVSEASVIQLSVNGNDYLAFESSTGFNSELDDFSDGDYDVVLYVSDAAGNEADRITLNITVDTQLLEPVVYSSKTLWNQTTVEMIMESEVGSSVDILLNGVVVDSYLQTQYGMVRTFNVVEGKQEFQLSVQDPAGNISESSVYTLMVDLTLPVIDSVLARSSEPVSQGIYSLDLSVSEPIYGVFQLDLEGDVIVGEYEAGVLRFEVPTGLNGMATLNVVSFTDSAGNKGVSVPAFSVFIDSEFPLIDSYEVIVSTNRGSVSELLVELIFSESVTLETDNVSIRLANGNTIEGVSFLSVEGGQRYLVSFEVDALDEDIDILVSEFSDAYGNTTYGKTLSNIDVDNIAPVVSGLGANVSAFSSKRLVDDASITITLNVDEDYDSLVVRVTDSKGNVVKTLIDRSDFSGDVAIVWNGLDNDGATLEKGWYITEAWAEDEFGNESLHVKGVFEVTEQHLFLEVVSAVTGPYSAYTDLALEYQYSIQQRIDSPDIADKPELLPMMKSFSSSIGKISESIYKVSDDGGEDTLIAVLVSKNVISAFSASSLGEWKGRYNNEILYSLVESGDYYVKVEVESLKGVYEDMLKIPFVVDHDIPDLDISLVEHAVLSQRPNAYNDLSLEIDVSDEGDYPSLNVQLLAFNSAIDMSFEAYDNATFIVTADIEGLELLTDGEYEVTVNVRDLAGNLVSSQLSVVLDNTFPNVEFDVASRNGIVSNNIRILDVVVSDNSGVYLRYAAGYSSRFEDDAIIDSSQFHGNTSVLVEAIDAAGNRRVFSKSIQVDNRIQTPIPILKGGGFVTQNILLFSDFDISDTDIDEVYYRVNEGSWSSVYLEGLFSLPFDFDDGDYVLEIKYVDEVGNHSEIFSKALIKDTTKPILFGVSLGGASLHEGVHYVREINYDGWWPSLMSDLPYEVTMMYRFYSQSGSVLNPEDLTEGEFLLQAQAIDFAGNSSEWVDLGTIVLDATPVSISSFSLSEGEEWVGLTEDRYISFQLSDSNFKELILTVEKVLSEGNLSVVKTVSYSQPSLDLKVQDLFSGFSEGEYKVSFVAFDKAGNTTDSETLTIKYDATAPQFSLSVPSIYMSDLIINVDNLIELGSRDVVYRVNGYKLNHVFVPGQPIVDAVTWVQDALSVTATDIAGNSRTVPLGITVIVDKYAPLPVNFRIDNMPESRKINPYLDPLDVRLTYSPQSSVDSGFNKYEFNLKKLSSSGEFLTVYQRIHSDLLSRYIFTGGEILSAVGTLSGVYKLEVKVYDKAGNHGTEMTDEFTIDISSPVLGQLFPKNNTTGVLISENEYINHHRDGLRIDSEVSDDNGVSKIYYKAGSVQRQALGFPLVLGAETLPLDNDGAYDIEVWIEDDAGNISQVRTFRLVVDRVAPSIEQTLGAGLDWFNDNLRLPAAEQKEIVRLHVSDESDLIESSYAILDNLDREWVKTDFFKSGDYYSVFWNGFINLGGEFEQAPSVLDYSVEARFVDKANNVTLYTAPFNINADLEVSDTEKYPPYSASIQFDNDSKWYLKYGIGGPDGNPGRVTTKTKVSVRDGDNDHFRSIPHPFIIDIPQKVYFYDENWKGLSDAIYRPVSYWKDTFSSASSHYRMELYEYKRKETIADNFTFPIPELNSDMNTLPYGDFFNDFSRVSGWPRNYSTGNLVRYSLPSKYEGKSGFLQNGVYLHKKHPEGGGTTLSSNYYYLMMGIKNYHSDDYHEHMSLTVQYSYYALGYRSVDINSLVNANNVSGIVLYSPLMSSELYGPSINTSKTAYDRWDAYNSQVFSDLFQVYEKEDRFLPLVNAHNGSNVTVQKNGYWYYVPMDYPLLPVDNDIVDINIEPALDRDETPFVGISWIKKTGHKRQLFFKMIYKDSKSNLGTQTEIELKKTTGQLLTLETGFGLQFPKTQNDELTSLDTSTPEFRWTISSANQHSDTVFKIQLKKTITVEESGLPTFSVVEGVNLENNQTIFVRSYDVSGSTVRFTPSAQDSLGNTDDGEVYQWQVQADWDGDGVYDATSTTSEIFEVNAPLEIESAINYPNPFKRQTYIRYKLNEDAKSVTIRIFDVAGRVVRTFKHAPTSKASGSHEYHDVFWDGKNGVGDPVLNGVYVYKIIAKDFNGRTVRKTGKMARLR